MNALNPEIDPEMQFTISDFVDQNVSSYWQNDFKCCVNNLLFQNYSL